MWIGALLLEVRARPDRGRVDDEDVSGGGYVAVRVLREQDEVPGLALRFPAEHDFHPSTARGHAFYFDRQFFDRPRQRLSPAAAGGRIGHPPTGLEMASGISGHLRLDLELDGIAAWPIDQIRVHVREYRRTLSPSDTVTWELDPDWRHIGTFPVPHAPPLTLAFLTRR